MKTRPKRSAMIFALTAALCGGSLFTSCVTRLNMAAVDGSKNFLFQFLNDAASNMLDNLAGTDTQP